MATNFRTPPSTQHNTHSQTNTMPYYTFTSAANNQPTNTNLFDYNNFTRQLSPLASGHATPTDSSSPTSPQTASTSPSNWRNQCQSRQLRPPKAPLYVPAVLRPTEKPAKFCRQNSSSTTNTSFTGVPGLDNVLTPPSTPSTSFDSNGSGMQAAEEGVLRRMLGEDIARAGVTRVVTDEWNDEFLEDVTGLPTRDHWKPDTLSPHCDNTSPPCGTAFSLFTRRHHCRRCGNIFCTTHSTHTVPLDQHARFHPNGAGARACDSCWVDYTAWKKARKARGSISTEGSSGSVTPKGDGQSVDGIEVAGGKGKGKQEIVGSMPRDWNWSTF